MDAHVAQVPARAQRDVVLGDLVALGEVGIEVVLAVEDRARRDLTAQRETHHDPVGHGLGVGHRQRAREAEADRAGAGVGLLAEAERAAAEHLRAGLELDVDLQPDHGLVARAHANAPDPSKPIACSSANAASRMRFSLNAGPAIWKPTGSPSESPLGIEMPGMPASDIGTVQTSLMYIASGSWVLEPSSKATPSAVGVTTKSNRPHACS